MNPITIKKETKCKDCKHIRKDKYEYWCIQKDCKVKLEDDPLCKKELFELRNYYLIREL